MNVENILKYQKKDAELHKVEQKIANNPYKKKANELANIAKKAQSRSIDLESEAEKIISELSDLKEKYNINKNKANELVAKDLDKLSIEDLDKLSSLKGKIASNLNVLEKLLQKSAENINHILAEFNNIKKTYDEAKTQYSVCKKKFEEESLSLEPEREKLANELKEFEKGVDAKMLAEYKKKRSEGIFPVLVPLENGNFCGFCRMELPKIAISKIKEKGVITCEHCKRFIYQ